MPIDWSSVPTRVTVPFSSKAEMRNFAVSAVQKPALRPATYQRLLRDLNDARRLAGLDPLERLPGVGVVGRTQRSVGTLTAKGSPGTDGVLVDPERLNNQIRKLEYSREVVVTTRIEGGMVYQRLTVPEHELGSVLGREPEPAKAASGRATKRTRKQLLRSLGL